MPHPGGLWRPRGQPATQPHEYVRGGTSKLLTLFHPASGRAHVQSVSRRCTNPILHGWLKERILHGWLKERILHGWLKER
ncbi:MAG: hypothetical protein ACJ8H8_27595, partial [Geminicoccaceae bacterium]